MVHILSIDLEDWYHGHYPGFNFKKEKFEISRVIEPTELILDVLDDTDSKATFFVLGVIAEKYPDLMKKIVFKGHKLACHGWDHDLISSLGRENFEKSIIKTKAELEKYNHEEVIGYRAPNFSVGKQNARWVFEILSENGFKYDSSLFPGRVFYGGMPSVPKCVHYIEKYGLFELPPSVIGKFGVKFALGGFYLRVLTLKAIERSILKNESENNSAMLYFHPKDIDVENPDLPVGPISNWIHQVGVMNCLDKIKKVLSIFKFTSIENYLNMMGNNYDEK